MPNFARPAYPPLDDLLTQMKLTDGIDFDSIDKSPDIETVELFYPTEEYGFLHETAIIEFHGKLFASWYSCPKNELRGYTPIRGTTSIDGGRTWSPVTTIEEDPSGKILYCPPVYGIDGDRLYMLVNEMVSADHMHALNLYIYKEETDNFERLWSRPIPFKLNTNVYRLANGKLLLPGRIAELDGFPNTPAVLISDSGKINAEWRLVKIAEDGNLPDGSKYVHPELSAIIDGETVWIFSRNDEHRVPTLYRSDDNGETWSAPMTYEIPMANSKIYSGTLADGRNYLIGNLDTYAEYGQYSRRQKLVLFLSEPHALRFTKAVALQDGFSEELGYGGTQWSYPVAHEYDGKLYVIYTACVDPADASKRGAVVSIVDLKKI